LTPSSSGLAALTQAQLDTWAVQACTYALDGHLPNYIPLLALANPTWFAVQVRGKGDRLHTFGNTSLSFPLMSVVKPFVLLFLLEQLGTAAVFSQVGMVPSDESFNSLIQLQADQGWPRNPMINSGAIVLASLLPGQDARTRCEGLRQWLNQQADCQLFLDEQMLISVLSLENKRNRAIVSLLEQSHHLELGDMALDTYNRICCLSGTVADLSSLGMLLVQGKGIVLPAHSRVVNAIMTTCGLYEASGRFAVQVGLPTKSGVSGAMLSVVPNQGAIACYSPPLDPMGNSKAGQFFLQQMTHALNLSVFG